MGAESSKAITAKSSSDPGSPAVKCKELVIQNPTDGYEIPCKLWTPDTTTRIRATALFIHGGAFSLGDRDSQPLLVQALVQQLGLAVVTASFRDGSSTTYATGLSLSDLESCTNYLQTTFFPNKSYPFGIIGYGSGGYFALSLCNALDFGQTTFCILICPVANPHARGVYLKHCVEGTTPLSTGKDLYPVRHNAETAQYILTQQLRFFETFKQMAVAADAVHQNIHQIPTLLILGTQDTNVPPIVTQHTMMYWATRAVVLPAGHELGEAPPVEERRSYIPDADLFLTHVLQDGGYYFKRNGSLNSSKPWCS